MNEVNKVVVRLGGAWGLPNAHKIPEANIQAEFYHCCRSMGINCVLEFSTCCRRHDVLVLDETGQNAVALIECKAGREFNWNGTGRQARRYLMLHLPVYSLSNMSGASSLAVKMKELVANPSVRLSLSLSKTMIKKKSRGRARPKPFSVRDLDSDLNFRH